MKARTNSIIEGATTTVAAASLAGALGYAVTVLISGFYDLPIVPGLAAAAIAFTGTRAALKRIDPRFGATNGGSLKAAAYPQLALSDFLVVGAPVRPMVSAEDQSMDEPLLLDDVLTQVGPGSRVTQLFGQRGQPSAGELTMRIDRHLKARPHEEGPDESAAMFDALNRLRGSLR